MDHANNAVYLDWLEESIVGASDPATARAAMTDLPRRYRMEFALAAAPDVPLDGAVWRVGEEWCYRLAGADDGLDRYRARITVGPAAANDAEEA